MKGAIDAFWPGSPVSTIEMSGAVVESVPKINERMQANYEEYGEMTGEWGPGNDYYYNMGVKTKDGKSYLERINQRE